MEQTFSLPQVGDGATMSVGSDRYPYTVIKVTKRTVTIQRDDYTPAAGHEYFGAQRYLYTPNPNGSTEVVRFTTRGWRALGHPVSFTGRSAYQDPSF